MDFLSKLLKHFNLTNEDYENLIRPLEYKDLRDFLKFDKIEEVSNYLNDLILNNKKIIVYGDYDCDGIMATSIIVNMFKYKNFDVKYYIPNRKIDGYGLNKTNIEKIKNTGYDVIICVDNGITLIDEIDYANYLGLDVLIFDHHTPMEKLPNAKYILHPQVSHFGEINISAGAVCFYLSRVFLNENNEYLATLAMISTISDMMELKDYNRDLVRLGLNSLLIHKYLNIRLLLNDKGYSESTISSYVIPKINAIGRIELNNSLQNIVKYFTSDVGNNDLTMKRVEWIEEVNARRKQLVLEASEKISVKDDDNSIVLVTDIEEGLCGLVANKILDSYKKPVIVLTKTENNVLKGSCRSRGGIDLAVFLNENSDILLTYGGHAQACGISLKEEYLDSLRERLNKASENLIFSEENDDIIDISLNEINVRDCTILKSFSPFGQGFKMPTFRIDTFAVQSLKFTKDHRHIRTALGMNSTLIYFNYDKDILNNNFVSFIGALELNEYYDKKSAQFRVISYSKK